MNRRILAAGFIAIAFFVAACGEDGDLQSPPDVEPSQAIDVLVVTALEYPQLAGSIHSTLAERGVLPTGSTIDTFSLLDGSKMLVIPSLEFLLQYDALLTFSDRWPADDPSPEGYDTIGDLMADYADAGGGLVLCQYTISCTFAAIRGRLHASRYAPLKEGTLEPDSDDQDRSLVLASIDLPLHPVFHGIDIDTLRLPGFTSLGIPELDDFAVLLAVDDRGTNAIAINPSGDIIGLNMYFKAFAFPDEYPETIKLVANSLLYVSGADKE